MDEGDSNGRIIPFPRPASARQDVPKNGAESGHAYASRLLTLKKRSVFIRRVMLALPRWITPNGVTVFRGLLIVPIAYLLRAGWYGTALGVIAVAMLLDFVDGALAEARDMRTTSGAFLDPLADKVLICGSLLVLLDRLPDLFVWPVGICCLIAALLTMVRLVKMAKASQGLSEPKVAAKPAGKLKLVAETASLLLIVLGLALAVPALVWTGGAFLLVSLWYAAGSLKAQTFG